MSRLETMAKAIGADLPEFIKLIPPTEQSEGLYRRIRHIQKTGECCGYEMSLDQLRTIIALASDESIQKPLNFLCVVLSRLNVQRTLKTASSRLCKDERLPIIQKYVKLEFEWQKQLVSDLIYGNYSINDIIIACEIAMKKQHPDRYLIACFRNGLYIR